MNTNYAALAVSAIVPTGLRLVPGAWMCRRRIHRIDRHPILLMNWNGMILHNA